MMQPFSYLAFFLLVSCSAGSVIITGDATDLSTGEADADEPMDDSAEEDVGGEQDVEHEVALCDPAVIGTTAWTGCGDGVLDPAGEECDDGNILDNDGCSWDCRLESGPPREPEASPLVLPRFCDGRGPVTLAAGVTWMHYTNGPVFWWSGSDYRVFFQVYSTRGWVFTLAACDRDGGNVRILAEHVLEGLDGGRVPISMSNDGPEVFFRGTTEGFNDTIGYMSFDMSGVVRMPYRVLYEIDPSETLASTCWFAHAGNRSEIMIEIFGSEPSSSRVIAFNRTSAELEACKATWPGFEHPHACCDNLAAEDGSGGYMLAYVSVMTPDGVPSFQLLVPEQETVPSDFRIRPVCSWGWSVPGGFGMDIKHDGNYYTALFRCLHSLGCGTEPNETRVLARFDSHGNLAAAPAILPLDDCSMCNDSNIALAFGEGTIGVFLVCPGKAYFQTLDEDGRYVGEPCDVSALVDHDSYLEVLGLAWDGEGYGVALIVDSDIRFYRFLPSS